MCIFQMIPYNSLRLQFTNRFWHAHLSCFFIVLLKSEHSNVMKNFRPTSKDYSVKPRLVSDQACKNVVKTHVSHFGPLFPQTCNTWTTRNNDHYSCSWIKTKTNHFKHFTVKTITVNLLETICFYISLLHMLSVITINSFVCLQNFLYPKFFGPQFDILLNVFAILVFLTSNAFLISSLSSN